MHVLHVNLHLPLHSLHTQLDGISEHIHMQLGLLHVWVVVNYLPDLVHMVASCSHVSKYDAIECGYYGHFGALWFFSSGDICAHIPNL